MKENEELLNYINKNSEMGIVGINDILFKVKSKKIYTIISKEKEEYEEICKKCQKLAKKFNFKLEKISSLAIMGSEMFSQMKLMKDDSEKNIVEMMINGSYKGLVVLKDRINQYKEADKEILMLANVLYDTINNNLEKLKKCIQKLR